MMWSLVAETLALLGRGLPDDARPAATPHPEPLPDIPSFACHQLAMFVGRGVSRALLRSEEPFNRVVANRDSLYRDDPSATMALRWIARTFVSRVGPDETFDIPSSLPPALAKVVREVISERGTNVARRLLEDIDNEHRRLDSIHAVDGRGLMSTSLITTALYRGTDVWLTLLESGRYGLLWRRDRAWVFTEGDRDEVLAHVPDHHFEPAACAAARRAA